MIELLLCSLITSLFTLGLKISTGEGMLLYWVKFYLDKAFIIEKPTGAIIEYGESKMSVLDTYEYTSKLYYPILYCIKCMPSLYGTLLSFLLLPFTLHLFYQIPLIIFCSVTLNCVIYQMYE